MIFTIRLADASRLRLEWSKTERSIHDLIIARIKMIHGWEWDKDERCWYVPVTALYAALDLFPKAETEYVCFQAADAAKSRAAAQFVALLARNGARLDFDESGDVVAVGECVSPLVADEVRKRSDALRAHVGSQVVTTPHRETQGAVEVTDDDRKWELVLTGIKNAYAAEQERGTQRRRKGYE